MAIIKNISELKPVIETGKALQTIQKASPQVTPEADGWQRFERVIEGIDHLLETALKYKQTESGALNPQVEGRQYLPNERSGARQNADTGAPAERVYFDEPKQTEKDVKSMEIQNKIIQFFGEHISNCQKENPNMTLGESIMKLPVNVTQLNVLLELYKKQNS